ncbi:hypothetical protein GCAAIG_01130 [Candidatus Electronema halotolerans]
MRLRFCVTYSAETVEQMLEAARHLDILVFSGIFSLVSARNAEFLHNEVPSELRRRLAQFEQVADQRKAALEYTADMIAEIAHIIDGLYLISPLNK